MQRAEHNPHCSGSYVPGISVPGRAVFGKTMAPVLKHQKGFTLLEILVVLTIMGFLIAMVAPRLAGISGDAVDTVCDSNQNRMVTYMSTYYEDTNRYPSKLTNLVITDQAAGPLDATTVYQIPAVSNQDPDDEAEVLSNELYGRNHFHIHYLDADEADELKNMGIVGLLNLNDYSGMDAADLTLYDNDVNLVAVGVGNERPSMEPVTPQDPTVVRVGVAMVGCGKDVANAWVATNATERGWGEPDNFGRIVLGMGPECGLITSGVISNAAHCPGGIQNSDNVIYNDYILLLPRLEATSARMTGAGFGGCTVNLLRREYIDAFEKTIKQRYKKITGILPDIYVTRPTEGVKVLELR